MKLIKADHDRRIEIPGVAEPVRRPVDIDRARTGFSNLRSLRIYQFDAGSTIDGHAEEDEVFVVVLAGSVEFTASGDSAVDESPTLTLSAADEFTTDPCAAYLPPEAAYRLVAKTDAAVAYARATPANGNRSAAFTPRNNVDAAAIAVLFEEKTYGRCLRLRLLHINTSQGNVVLTPLDESEASCEALVHFRTLLSEGAVTIETGAGGAMLLQPWDTAVVAPEDRPNLHIPTGISALILVVFAT